VAAERADRGSKEKHGGEELRRGRLNYFTALPQLRKLRQQSHTISTALCQDRGVDGAAGKASRRNPLDSEAGQQRTLSGKEMKSMMTYDPLQSYAGSGAYTGIGNPFNTTQFSPINPAAAWNPLTAYQGNPNSITLGHPQAALWQNPLFVAQQIGAQQAAAQQLAQHVVAQQVAQHIAQQLVAQQLGAQQLNQAGAYPQAGQFGPNGQYGQSISPFGQIGMPLAPQSWVGQAGQPGNGQANPLLLAHFAARALQAQGFVPGAGFQP
jgi:hypothetical protein